MSDPAVQEKDTSVDDDVRAALESLRNPTPANNDGAVLASDTPAAPLAGETQDQADQRARDEAGRFAKADSNRVKPVGATEPKPGEAAKAPDPAAAQTGQAPAVAAAKAPDGWSAPMKAEFAKLPSAVQQEITRREGEMHKKFTAQDEERSFGKRVKETLNPYMATILAEGGTPEQAINELFKTALILRSPNPQVRREAVLAIAQQFGVELGNAQLQQGASQSPAYQPQQIEQLVQASVERISQQQEQSKLLSEIEAFAADPANVHYETVKPIMAALMGSGKAETLRDAYDQAIWTDPAIRSTLSAAELARAEEQRTQAARATTDKAKRASGSVVGGPGGTAPIVAANQERSLEDEIRANYRAAVGGRV